LEDIYGLIIESKDKFKENIKEETDSSDVSFDENCLKV